MSERTQSACLQDIRDAITSIIEYTQTMEYDDLLGDRRTQDAVIRNLEVIGEAVKLLSKETRNSYPEVPWHAIAGMRNKLIHEYFGINLDIVWEVIRDDLPHILHLLSATQ